MRVLPVVVYQNDKTGMFVTPKHRFRPPAAELRALITELKRDTGTLSVWWDDDEAQWFRFEEAGIFREEAADGTRSQPNRQAVDAEQIFAASLASR